VESAGGDARVEGAAGGRWRLEGSAGGVSSELDRSRAAPKSMLQQSAFRRRQRGRRRHTSQTLSIKLIAFD
jgi:hypothetical protein